MPDTEQLSDLASKSSTIRIFISWGSMWQATTGRSKAFGNLKEICYNQRCTFVGLTRLN